MNKTDMIFQGNGCPYNNSNQGISTRILFVCTGGLLRSPTAAKVAIQKGYNARSCGSNINIALIPISANLIKWAEIIIFMNSENYDKVKRALQVEHRELLGLLESKMRIWDIEDIYDYDDYSLKWKVERLLEPVFDKE